MEKQNEGAPSFLNISIVERKEEYVSVPPPGRNRSMPATKEKQVSASSLEGCPQILQLWCGQQWSTRSGNEYEVLDHLNRVRFMEKYGSVLPHLFALCMVFCVNSVIFHAIA
ncbi:hypothetical protein EJ110_NYTH14044 [Nymphaea thermarum]|nr:hypothetical protein EJ110_NYTH14044 [Nymphaea thermarum]